MHLHCALGFVKVSPHIRDRSTTITCSNLAAHSEHQHITLGPLVAQIRITLNVSSLADSATLMERVL